MNKSYFFPVALIVVGVLLLLHQFGLLYLSRFVWIITFSILIGLVLLNKSRYNPKRRGLTSGLFFLFFAGMLVLMNNGIFPVNDRLGFALLAVAYGLSEVLAYLISRQSVLGLSLGVVAILIAMPILLNYYQVWAIWSMYELLATYWPILLIAIGLGFLMDGYRKSAGKTENR